mgnify:CR=1 FL=1
MFVVKVMGLSHADDSYFIDRPHVEIKDLTCGLFCFLKIKVLSRCSKLNVYIINLPLTTRNFLKLIMNTYLSQANLL